MSIHGFVPRDERAEILVSIVPVYVVKRNAKRFPSAVRES
jgi:hypothetical protein